jgi:hypothetical protein
VAVTPLRTSSHIASSIDICSTLTLEQQHRDIIAAEGTVPTLQNMVAIVNLDCTLDLKTTIALHTFTGMFFFLNLIPFFITNYYPIVVF